MKYIKNPSKANDFKYKQFRNKLNMIIKNVKSEYFKSQFDMYKNNIKGTWRVINSLIKKNGRLNSDIPMDCNGTNTTDHSVIADSFNKFFVEIGPSLARKINPSVNSFHKYLPDLSPNSLYLNPVSEYEICKIVKSLKHNKAPGLDECSPKVIKEVIGLLVSLYVTL